MPIASLFSPLKSLRGLRRRQQRDHIEMDDLTLRELADVYADRTEVLDGAYFHVHGTLGSTPESARTTIATWAGRRRKP